MILLVPVVHMNIVTLWIALQGFLKILACHVFHSSQWNLLKRDCITCSTDICHGVTWSCYTGGTWPWLSLRLKLFRRSGFRMTTSVLLQFICNFSSFQLCDVFWSRLLVVICWNHAVSYSVLLFSVLGYLRRALRCVCRGRREAQGREWSEEVVTV